MVPLMISPIPLITKTGMQYLKHNPCPQLNSSCRKFFLSYIFFQCMSLVHVLNHFSGMQLFATLWITACQPPLSIGFSRQEHCSELPCPPPGDLPNAGTGSTSPGAPALQADTPPLLHSHQPPARLPDCPELSVRLSPAVLVSVLISNCFPGVNVCFHHL